MSSKKQAAAPDCPEGWVIITALSDHSNGFTPADGVKQGESYAAPADLAESLCAMKIAQAAEPAAAAGKAADSAAAAA